MRATNPWVISCVAVLFSAGVRPALGADLDTLIPELRNQEQQLRNIKVSAHYASEFWDVGAQEWKPAGEADLTAWFVGIPGSKVRVDFHREIARWVDGKAPYGESTYRVAYNGCVTKRLQMSVGAAGRAFPVLVAKLSAGRPSIVRDYGDFASGWRFSLFGVLDDRSVRLSDMLAATNSRGARAIVREEQVAGERATTIELSNPSIKRVLVLQPDKGYSLLSAEKSLRGVVIERLTVEEVRKVGPDLYYPSRAVREIFHADGVPRERSAYEASVISINDPNWDDSVFDPEWPAGTVVQDQIAGTVYHVASSEQRLEQVIGEQISWFGQGHAPASEPAPQRQPAAEPAPNDGKGAGAVHLLPALCVFPIVLALGALALVHQRRPRTAFLLPLCFFRRRGG